MRESITDYRSTTEDEIESIFKAGKCLEVALWRFLATESYRDATLKTDAAACGQVAGAYYGFDFIPESWVSSLKKNDVVLEFAQRLHAAQPE